MKPNLHVLINGIDFPVYCVRIFLPGISKPSKLNYSLAERPSEYHSGKLVISHFEKELLEYAVEGALVSIEGRNYKISSEPLLFDGKVLELDLDL
jgi:hypothetical protein